MANQAKEGGTRPPQSSKANHVKPDSSVIARAAGVLLVCVLLATVVVAMLWWHQDSVYRYVGGEIRHVSAQSTPQEVLKEVYPDKSQKELDLIRALQEKTTLYISHTVTAYWVSQTFHNGWIQYAIVLGFVTGLFYTICARLGGLIPGWHLSSAPRRFRSIARQMGEMRMTGVTDIKQIIDKIDGSDRFADRLHKLQQHYTREPSRQLCREANEAYSQSEQAEAIYVILPLGFIEFLLPIFGFIGTVLGVSNAVASLRWGMSQLFKAGELTEGVMSQFMAGFDGLVLAFMTTLFGLLGLAVTALFRFYLRRNAMAVIAKIDQWSEEAINLLPQEDLLKTVAEGLILHDENGDPVRDENNQVIPRWMEALAVVDETGRPVRDGSNRLIPRWMEVLAETGEDGRPVCDEHGRPVSLLHKLDEVLRKALFEPGKDGEKPIPALQGVRTMIKIATDAVYGIHNALMHHIYQIVGYDDRNQYTDLIVYTTDEETGETHSMEVQGRYRSERQHIETVGWMRMLTEEVIRNMEQDPRDPKDPPPPNPGRLVVQPAEESVRRIAASTAAFAVIRGTDHTTGESELISGCYETVMGQMLPCEADRKRLPMAITGLGFSAGEGTEALRFGVYMPFAPTDPWQQHGARQLLPAKPLVRCAAKFLRDHEVVSENIPFMRTGEITWLLFLAREVEGGKIGLFALRLENTQGTPHLIGDLMEGELATEAVFQGTSYAFTLRKGGTTNLVLACPGENEPVVRCVESQTDVVALAFDSAGTLHYASRGREIGAVDPDKGNLKRTCRLDRPGEVTHLAYSSQETLYVALRDSAELLMVRMDGGSGKEPESKSVPYPRLITTLTASSDGRFIFVGCADGSVYVRNG